MKFLDLAKVIIRSGAGGNGSVSFRREAHVEFGGPDGGDGGKGGDVWVECVDGLNTLIDFRYQQHFFAGNGKSGMGKARSGKDGEDIVLKVPVGTEVLDEDEETVLADLTEPGQRVKLAQGGKGVLKEAARKVIPSEVIDRKKGYFPVPALKYIEGPYLDMVRDTLTSQAARERGLFRDDYLNTLFDAPKDHITPLRGSELWQVSVLETWLQTHGI